ncbi:MAG: DUF3106 domain-containing protein [Rubrivivax sp.]|nr:DUF3106 domain-containing protein [Rubrivivax sp.]
MTRTAPLPALVALAAVVAGLCFAAAAASPGAAGTPAGGTTPARAPGTPSGPTWNALSASQQQALAPLRPDWDSIDATRKRKWVEVADRFPAMPADERKRVQERMAAWAALTPAERTRARVQFQETRRIGAEERQAGWQAYQALPEDERKRLAQAAKGKAPARPVAQAQAQAQGPGKAGPSPVSLQPSGPKRNVVVAAPAPRARSVAPTVVQAKPGASTTTVATPAKPPLHHQAGLPKVVATPSFVDPNTLLPRRGPQAAAMRTAASADPTREP